MNWNAIENGEVSGILAHWQKLGQFRERHPVIGAGEHRLISQQPYVFSRTNGDDRVVIAFGRK